MSDQDNFEVPNYDDPAVMAGVKNGNVAVPTQPESSMSQVEFIAGLRVIPEILENMSHGKSLRIDGERGDQHVHDDCFQCLSSARNGE